MKHRTAVIVAVATIGLMVLSNWQVEAGWQADQNAWETFHNDDNNTGVSTLKARLTIPRVKWVFRADNYVFSSPVVADIDASANDGPEVLFGTASGTLYCLGSLSNNTPTQKWTASAGRGIYFAPAIGDINNDNTPEIVYTSEDGIIYAVDNQGQSIWQYRTGGFIYSDPKIVDIDDDGINEIIFGSGDKKIYALKGNVGVGEDPILFWTYTTNSYVLHAAAISDIDGDGKMEVVMGSYDRNVYALNGEDGSLLWRYTGTSEILSSPTIADFYPLTPDGKKDVVITTYSGNVVAINGQTGKQIWSKKPGRNIEWSSTAVGDLNNDNKPEIVFGGDDGYITVLSGDGNTKWRKATGGAIYSSPALADLDNDNKLEIFFGSYDMNLYVYEDTGQRKWAFNGQGGGFASPAFANIDGDANGELIMAFVDSSAVYAFDR